MRNRATWQSIGASACISPRKQLIKFCAPLGCYHSLLCEFPLDMERHRLETFLFIFKIIVFLLLSFNHKFVAAQETRNKIGATFPTFPNTDRNYLVHRMSQIEKKDRQQDKDISFLRATAVEDRKLINQLRGRVLSLEASVVIHSASIESSLARPKRSTPLQNLMIF